jgi:hypothetical protein
MDGLGPLNFLVFQWFFHRRVLERVPLIEKYSNIIDFDTTELNKEHAFVQLVSNADERPLVVTYPPDLYDLLSIAFYEKRWVRAWPMTGWFGGRIKTF